MARTSVPVEVNSYVKGLITEASPLTFPDGASVSEVNFVLNRDGTRRRRLGMDLEEDHVEVDTGVVLPSDGNVSTSTFRWFNAGGNAQKSLSVVQVGNTLSFFDLDIEPLSSGLLLTHTVSSVSVDTVYSMAAVDGMLVVATGDKQISIFSFDGDSTVVQEDSTTLKIRDLFGVEDINSGDSSDLRDGNNITTRPLSLTDTHLYNLRNQTWAEPRMTFNSGDAIKDTVVLFNNAVTYDEGLKYPSNSDTVNSVLYPNAEIDANRIADRFNAPDLHANPLGTTAAPRGHFIIDAMARGTSRLSEMSELRDRYSEIQLGISSLPSDTTPGGPSVVAEYAGRAWFGGFSSEVVGGDKHSPRMASYILFSQLVENSSSLGKCYQEASPTSPVQSDLVDTDGGFIRLDGAYGIKRLVNVGRALLVFASNGVWSITGGSDFGFSATNYLVEKITDRGCDAPLSIVVVDNNTLYWGYDGIYQVAPNEVGSFQATNITQTTIQSFYDSIDSQVKDSCIGTFDDIERKVKWVYDNDYSSVVECKELILDLTLGSFYPSEIRYPDSATLPKVVSPVDVPPFKYVSDSDDVFSVTDQVLSDLDEVVIELKRNQNLSRSTYYVAITDTTDTVKFSFSFYRDQDFLDWKTADGVGTDADANMITGWLSGGDYLRMKQAPYIRFFFRRTESGVVEDGDGNIFPNKQSSCKVQAQWHWADSEVSGRWGREFQAYREKRFYMPESASGEYDVGFAVVETKSKFRGKGSVLSFLIKTEPGKDLQLLGWSMVVSLNGNI